MRRTRREGPQGDRPLAGLFAFGGCRGLARRTRRRPAGDRPLAGLLAFCWALALLRRLVRSVGGIAARFFLASPCAFSCADPARGPASAERPAPGVSAARARRAWERAARRGPVRGAMGLSASSGEVFALWESLCAPLCEGRRRARSEVTRAGSFVLSGRVHRIRPATPCALK